MPDLQTVSSDLAIVHRERRLYFLQGIYEYATSILRIAQQVQLLLPPPGGRASLAGRAKH